MDERQRWPESKRFVDDFEVRLACAELMAELLMSYGQTEWVPFGNSQASVVRTEHVDANDGHGRFRQALRVAECLYSYTHDVVTVGAPHVIEHTEPLSDDSAARAFTLEFGTLDLETVDPYEVLPSDYEWHSIAVAVVDISVEEQLTTDNITLVDAEDGIELTDERAFDLHALLTAVASELRSSNFSDSTTLEEISSPELEVNITAKNAREFHAVDFIEGVGCDECDSPHSICAHNGSAN